MVEVDKASIGNEVVYYTNTAGMIIMLVSGNREWRIKDNIYSRLSILGTSQTTQPAGFNFV